MKKGVRLIAVLLMFVVVAPLMLTSCSDGENSVFAKIGVFWKDVERAEVEHSQQYVYSQVSILYTLYEEYISPDMTKAQRQYLEARMRRVANEIPASEVPREIAKLIY